MESSTTPKKIESENFNLQDGAYQLKMTLYSDDYIEFKIIPNSQLASCYYIEKYDFEKIKKISFLTCDDMKKAFQIYKNIFKNIKINLILSQDQNIMTLNYKRIFDFIEEKEINLELKKENLEKEDIIDVLRKEVENLKKESHEKNIYYENKIDELKKENEKMKKDIDFLMGEYNKKLEKEKQEEIKRIIEEQKEKELQKEEEELSSKNDNVNLINDFKFENIKQIKNIDTITFPDVEFQNCNFTVYSMIKNNERLYQMAYVKRTCSSYQNYIIIYDLVKKKVENKIFIYYDIHKIQHYYNSSNKNHYLLISGGKIQLWNITSNNIINILTIEDDKSLYYITCLLFINENFFIYGLHNGIMGYWDQNRSFNNLNNSKINQNLSFIEATYIEDKKYILMAGHYYSNNINKNCLECYDYVGGTIRDYEITSYIQCINLFKKGDKIYLIACNENKINVFDFSDKNNTNPIREISLNKVYSLCSINQKYIIATELDNIKIINMENFSVEQSYPAKHYNIKGDDILRGIKKIKIPEKGELIITFSEKAVIKIWKI